MLASTDTVSPGLTSLGSGIRPKVAVHDPLLFVEELDPKLHCPDVSIDGGWTPDH